MEIKYIHETAVHNIKAPSIIVPKLIDMFSPQSVVDFGCGIGTFLNIFIREGVTDVLGLDGPWVNKDLLKENLPENKFKAVNLENHVSIDKKYDLAISLEVAEHLDESKASVMVDNLVQASDLIVFSAAIPFQGGQNHINEQWPTYWVDLFSQYGYKTLDILRPLFWNDSDVFFWYKQNVFVAVKKGSRSDAVASNICLSNSTGINSIVHPDLYLLKVESLNATKVTLAQREKEISDLLEGRRGWKLYYGILKKYILRKFKIHFSPNVVQGYKQ